jgi:hypothetical protein
LQRGIQDETAVMLPCGRPAISLVHNCHDKEKKLDRKERLQFRTK